MTTGLFWQYRQFTDLNKFMNDFSNYVNSYKLVNITDIDNSSGYSLDLIGKIINVDRRPVLLNWDGFTWGVSRWGQASWGSTFTPEYQNVDDETFKRLLKARQYQLLTARTLNNILKTIEIMLPTMVYTYIESVNNLSITYEMSSITLQEKQLIEGNYILLPQGCTLTINSIV